jgi:hypothetical protein
MNSAAKFFIAEREKLENDLPNYKSALAEAATYIRKNESVPEDVIQKAVGERPNFCDSLDFETTFFLSYELELYKINRENFLNNAAKISEKCPN